MAPINKIGNKKVKCGGDIESLINELCSLEPSKGDLNTTKCISEDLQLRVQVETLRTLKLIQETITSHSTDLANVKKDLELSQKANEEAKKKIDFLEDENRGLTRRVNDLEVGTRSHKLILSGPSVDIENRLSPSQLRDQCIKNIKDIYHFDLKRSDVTDCQRFRVGANKRRIILSLRSAITKNALIFSTIKKNKSSGINLSINEFLSPQNSAILFNLRKQRKDHPSKIFSYFSRNGLVFYKVKKESRPKLIKSEAEVSTLEKELQERGVILPRGPSSEGSSPEESTFEGSSSYGLSSGGPSSEGPTSEGLASEELSSAGPSSEGLASELGPAEKNWRSTRAKSKRSIPAKFSL